MLGAARRGGRMVQTWVQRLYGDKNDRTLELELEYSFEVRQIPGQDCRLVVEDPEFYRFELNGEALEAVPAGNWICRDLPTIKLPSSRLVCGRNILRLRCRYSPDMPGLESLFILGEFGVGERDEILPRPEYLDCRSIVEQNFPYYSGNLIMRKKFAGSLLKGGKAIFNIAPDGWRGTLLGVKVNGGKEIILPWPPYTADITSYVTDGENTLEVIVYGHRRNSFGPFYRHEVSPAWVGANELESYFTDGVKNLVPFGLLKAPVIEFTVHDHRKNAAGK